MSMTVKELITTLGQYSDDRVVLLAYHKHDYCGTVLALDIAEAGEEWCERPAEGDDLRIRDEDNDYDSVDAGNYLVIQC